MKRLPLESEYLAPLPAEIDLRLIVTDMDGTLIDGDGRVPVRLDEVVARMREAGIIFAPASGRQLANLRAVLGHVVDDSPLIAESGALAVHGNEEIHSDTISAEEAGAVIATARELASSGYDVGTVVACKRCAYIERSDPAFLAQARLYYAALEIVDDLMTIPWMRCSRSRSSTSMTSRTAARRRWPRRSQASRPPCPVCTGWT